MKARHTRISPILTQNDNGPCPLLALVNVLVLTTPANQGTALIGTLFNKEQVSLGLLLDAVFDELTSGRRGDTAHELPDIGQLYSFLITLHTGMNVNPRFVEAEDITHPPQRVHPGTFEMTKEMRLYSTFDIPLIHGWIPSPTDAARGAFERQKVAQTYEDAQNMQFHAEELEAKFHSQGLSDDEQDIFTDVIAIKEFLTTYPTQLSDYGLETMKQWIQPGQVVILFRNDHFSTLYKQPDTGRLLTLVTDAGYATHDEIVWESLADVNGMYSELFSGDFRSVDNSARRVSMNQNPEDNSEWTTVKGKNPRHLRNDSTPNYAALPESTTNQARPSVGTITESFAPEASTRDAEQEDHDLALALQLQEEADAEQRAHDAARAEELAASERFLSRSTYVTQAQPEERPPTQPPRPTDRAPTQPPRPRRPPPTRGQVDGFDADSAPPPPYEPVQKTPTFAPPQQPPPPAMAPRPSDNAHRRHSSMQGPAMSPRPSENSQRGQSAMSSTQQPSSPVNPLTGRRRLQSRSSGVGTPAVSPGPATPAGNGPQKGKDEKCIVM